MMTFDAQDEFYIAGRGRVFTGVAPQDIIKLPIDVSIRGQKYRVRAVETAVIIREGIARKGERVGLLVEELKSCGDK